MTTNIKLKKSSVVGRVPNAGDLEYGEIAINYADGKIYYKNSSNDIKSFIDSALVQNLIDGIDTTALIDSDYVQLHAIGLSYNSLTNTPNVLDSADVLAISTANLSTDSAVTTQIINEVVDSGYVAGLINPLGRVGITETSFTASANQTDFSAAYVPGALIVTLNGIILLNGEDYTATNGSTVVLTEAADSGDNLIVTTFGGDSARIQGVVDSAYVQLRAIGLDYNSLTNTPSLDFADSASVISIVDSAYVQARQAETDLSSYATQTYVTTQISNLIDGAPDTLNTLNEIAAALNDDDSAYATLINLIGDKIDSTGVVNLVDSDYVQLRQDFAYSSLTGAPTVLDSANVTNLITAYGYSTFDSADAINLIDSAYVQARQSSGLDSSDIVNIIGNGSIDIINLSDSSGVLSWNSTEGTLNIDDGTGVVLQVGQEQHYIVRNATGSTIGNGVLVGFSGVTVGSNRIEVSPFNVATMDDYQLVGFATEDISNGVNGRITSFGYVRGLDTRGNTASNMAVGDETWSVGDILYPHPTTAGKLTNVRPLTGVSSRVGVITNRHQSLGEIFVRVTPTNINIVTDTVDSDYVQLRQDFAYSSLTGAPTVLDSTNVSNIVTDFGYTTFDSTAAIALITANAIDSAVALQLLLDSIETINLIDSAYVQARQTAQDFAYSSLTGAPNVLDSADVVSLITANDQQRDSAFITDIIDSDYIETRRSAEAIFNVVSNGASAYTFTGDGFTSGRDNPTLYLQRGLTYKFSVSASGHPFQIRLSDGGSAYNTGVTNNGVQSGNLIFTPDMNAPNTLVYQCTVHSGMVGDIVIINDNTFLDSAEATTLITDYGYTTYDSTNTLGLIDSAYINARVDAVSGTDSATVISLITSTVDSAYVQARQSSVSSGGGGLDSAAVLNLIPDGTVRGLASFNYIADSGQTSFSGADEQGNTLSYRQDSLIVFLNGTLMISGNDYTASNGTSVVFTEAVDSGDFVTFLNVTAAGGTDSAAVINLIDSDYIQARQTSGGTGTVDSDYVLSILAGANQAGVTDFLFTADSGQTVFTGLDLNSNSLSYVDGSIQVFLNGILLRDTLDYTASSGNTVTLLEGADSGDELSVFNIVTAGGTDSAAVVTIIEATVDSAYVQARQSSVGSGGLDSAGVLGILDNQNGVVNTFDFTAANGQTVFSGGDNRGAILTYNPGNIAVYLNGLFLADSADYTATTGTSVVLTEAAQTDDIISIMSVNTTTNLAATPSSNIITYNYLADSDQVTFNGADLSSQTLSYTQGRIQVFRNGILLIDSADYTATNGLSVTLEDACVSGDYVSVSVATGSTEAFITSFLTGMYQEATTDITAVANKKYIVDTTTAVTITLPSSPSFGDEIKVGDGTGDAETNNITITSSDKILGSDSDFVLDVNRAFVDLVYYNASEGWIVTGNS